VKGYLVDTNIPSELTREKPDARVAAFLRSTDKNSIYLSVMTIGEICKGIATLPVSQRRTALQDWLDIDVRFVVRRSHIAGHGSHCRTLGTFGRNCKATRFDLGSRGWRNCGNSPSSRPYPRHAQRQRLRGSRHRHFQSLGNIKPRKNMPNSTSLSLTGLTMPRP
jgi:hypothetical protein